MIIINVENSRAVQYFCGKHITTFLLFDEYKYFLHVYCYQLLECVMSFSSCINYCFLNIILIITAV